MSNSVDHKGWTQLKDLKPGNLIQGHIVIHQEDHAYPGSQSETSRRIKNGELNKRICIVLETSETSVQVTYLATFAESDKLPKILDKAMWYPFAPAKQEARFKPLSKLDNGKAQWASLRTKHKISANPVYKYSETIPEESVKAIKKKMRA